VLRKLEGLRFDREKLEPLKDGVKVGNTRLRLSTRRLGRGWQKALEEILTKDG